MYRNDVWRRPSIIFGFRGTFSHQSFIHWTISACSYNLRWSLSHSCHRCSFYNATYSSCRSFSQKTPIPGLWYPPSFGFDYELRKGSECWRRQESKICSTTAVVQVRCFLGRAHSPQSFWFRTSPMRKSPDYFPRTWPQSDIDEADEKHSINGLIELPVELQAVYTWY